MKATAYLFFGTGDRENPVTNTGTGKFYAIKDTDSSTTLLTESNLANLTSSINSTTGGTVTSTQFGWFIRFDSVASTANDTYTARRGEGPLRSRGFLQQRLFHDVHSRHGDGEPVQRRRDMRGCTGSRC